MPGQTARFSKFPLPSSLLTSWVIRLFPRVEQIRTRGHDIYFSCKFSPGIIKIDPLGPLGFALLNARFALSVVSSPVFSNVCRALSLVSFSTFCHRHRATCTDLNSALARTTIHPANKCFLSKQTPTACLPCLWLHYRHGNNFSPPTFRSSSLFPSFFSTFLFLFTCTRAFLLPLLLFSFPLCFFLFYSSSVVNLRSNIVRCERWSCDIIGVSEALKWIIDSNVTMGGKIERSRLMFPFRRDENGRKGGEVIVIELHWYYWWLMFSNDCATLMFSLFRDMGYMHRRT